MMRMDEVTCHLRLTMSQKEPLVRIRMTKGD